MNLCFKLLVFSLNFLVIFACLCDVKVFNNDVNSNCTSNLTTSDLTPDQLVQLHNLKFETIHNVHRITFSVLRRLLDQQPSLQPITETLVAILRLRFRVNAGRSIGSTASELKIFGKELNEMTEKWNQLTQSRPPTEYFQSQQVIFAKKINTITRDAANSIAKQTGTFKSVALVLLSGIRFGTDQVGYGKFNKGKSSHATGGDLRRFGDGLTEIANKWEQQVETQRVKCENYLNGIEEEIETMKRMKEEAEMATTTTISPDMETTTMEDTTDNPSTQNPVMMDLDDKMLMIETNDDNINDTVVESMMTTMEPMLSMQFEETTTAKTNLEDEMVDIQ